MNFDKNYLPQILCLVAQSSITAVTIIRIHDNKDQFPIRQLGPGSTIICSLCFLLSSTLNLIGKIIVGDTKDNCPLYTSNSLFVLAILYNMVRQLPFILFTFKTLRVSLCFWPTFNKINVQKIYKWFIQLLKNQTYFVWFSIMYVAVINLLNVIIFQMSYEHSYLFFQYFCPKDPTAIDFLVSMIRLLTLGFVLYLSLYTYEQLDFKKFLFLVFLISNISIIPHLFITLGKQITQQTIQRRDPIYFCSFIIQLLNTCTIFYFSGINKELNQPAMQGVLQSWQAFHNLKLGMEVLYKYADYRDKHTQHHKYNFRCLQSYDFHDQLLKLVYKDKNYIKQGLQGVQQVLTKNQLVRAKLGQSTANQLINKCKKETLKVDEIRQIQKILSNYCQTQIFINWKRTNSYKTLKQQLINNTDINQKLGLFGIPVS